MARETRTAFTVPDTASDPEAVLLYPDSLSDLSDVVDNATEGVMDRRVRAVHNPAVYPYLVEGASASPAVVICPGGGYGCLAFDHEGHEIARWLNSIGVAGIVLKYRLPRPPGGPEYGHEAPVGDALAAIRLVRERSAEWGVNPEQVGVMGFSAGGHLASSASTLFIGPADRPSFSILIYPVITFTDEKLGHAGSRGNLLGSTPSEELLHRFSAECNVTADTPPAFLLSTCDDSVDMGNSFLYTAAMRKAGVPAELHVYGEGGHGYGLREKDLPLRTWPKRLQEWIESTTEM